jgi:hypothetical protein
MAFIIVKYSQIVILKGGLLRAFNSPLHFSPSPKVQHALGRPWNIYLYCTSGGFFRF